MSEPQLPAAILQYPHWRVNIRPARYEGERIPTLVECLNLVRKCKLSLRGWDYPHIGNNPEYGGTWIGSSCPYAEHLEYWRFYQSAQFIHLFAFRESTDLRWRGELLKVTKSHLGFLRDVDWDTVPGFISIVNMMYNVTEVFEFAARLCQAQALVGKVEITIEMKGIRGFLLTTDWNRNWCFKYEASVATIGKTWTVDDKNLIAGSANEARQALVWLFERFGWSAAPELIRTEQESLLRGR